jgi:hypothetical protein
MAPLILSSFVHPFDSALQLQSSYTRSTWLHWAERGGSRIKHAAAAGGAGTASSLDAEGGREIEGRREQTP